MSFPACGYNWRAPIRLNKLEVVSLAGTGTAKRWAVAAFRTAPAMVAALLLAAVAAPAPARAAPQTVRVVASGGGPAVTKTTPGRGPTTGGSPVKVTGTGFFGATVVRFGGVAAPSFSVEPGEPVRALDVIAPPHAPGNVPITVTTPAGTSPVVPEGRFAYQAAHGHWTALPARQRSSHTATLLAGGRVLVAGGCIQPESTGRCAEATATAELYDPARRSWAQTGSMTQPRIGHLATLLADGRVLVSGGCAALGCSSEPNVFAPNAPELTAEIYDPRSGRWTPTGNMKFIHNHPTAALLPSGPPRLCGPNCAKVLVVGTASAVVAGQPVPAPTDAELYDPASGLWSPTAPSEHIRDKPASVLLHTGNVLVTGAVSNSSGAAVPADLYNPATATWAPTGNAEPSPTLGETATLLGDGRVLVVVGVQAASTAKRGEELYDPTALPDPTNPAVKGGAWTTIAALSDQRFASSPALLRDGTVLVVGGNPTPPLPTAELYTTKTATWAWAATMAGGRGVDPFNCGCTTFTTTTLHDGSVLVVGASYRTPQLYDEINSGYGPINNPATYGPSAELYTPAATNTTTNTTSNTLPAVGIGLGVAVLAALAFLLVVRRKNRPIT